jgi:DNA-binding response OmpR family regulator
MPITPAVKTSIRVFLVDDERTLRESCASVLAAEGYNVDTCGRGDEAIHTLKHRAFDIVLVDLFMS